MKKRLILGFATLAASLAVVGPAAAHHSFAMFDSSQAVYIEGVVDKWTFNNPHTWLYIRVTKKDGTPEIWGFEGSAPIAQLRKGITAVSFKYGELVRVVMCPLRDGRNGGHMGFVVLPDGKVITPNDGGCPGPSMRDEWTEKKWLDGARTGDTHPITPRAGQDAPPAPASGRPASN